MSWWPSARDGTSAAPPVTGAADGADPAAPAALVPLLEILALVHRRAVTLLLDAVETLITEPSVSTRSRP